MTKNTCVLQHLDFALCDRIPDYYRTRCRFRQYRGAPIDEEEWPFVVILLDCAAVDPAAGKLKDLFPVRVDDRPQ
jgi:hypothetical protein